MRAPRLFLGKFLGLCLVLPAAASVVSIGPYSSSATSPFVVPIQITDATKLESFSFDLNYNADDFQINESCDAFSGDVFCDPTTGPVTLGTFYTSAATLPSLFIPGFILSSATGDQIGQLVGVNGFWQDIEPAPSGDGVLAFVEFVAVSGGASNSSINVTNVQTSEIPPVPEPSSFAQFAVGLLALIWHWREWRVLGIRASQHDQPGS